MKYIRGRARIYIHDEMILLITKSARINSSRAVKSSVFLPQFKKIKFKNVRQSVSKHLVNVLSSPAIVASLNSFTRGILSRRNVNLPVSVMPRAMSACKSHVKTPDHIVHIL